MSSLPTSEYRDDDTIDTEQSFEIDNDQKNSKETNQSSLKEVRIVVIILVLLTVGLAWTIGSSDGDMTEMSKIGDVVVEKTDSASSSKTDEMQQKYELYPFHVDSENMGADKASSPFETVSQPLPLFPTIPRLEDCAVSFIPSQPPRKEQDQWRKMFWLPSFPFPGSDASNPTNKGDLLKQIIEEVTLGTLDERSEYGQPVKSYYASIENKLNRCKGISETIGCSCSHPFVPTSPETQMENFRSEVIVTIRNPATAIPAFFTYERMSDHNETKQSTVEEWKTMRDLYFESSFASWLEMIKYWRGIRRVVGATEIMYYQTALYVAFEDIITTDNVQGTNTIRKLSDTLSNQDTGEEPFETASSPADLECIWYNTAKNEWNRQQQIIGYYIPPYTLQQQTVMIQNLTLYVNELDEELDSGDIDDVENTNTHPDLFLISLLRRYIYQIENYLLVET